MSRSIKIKFWGVRGSTPCANTENMIFGGNTTCFQIESPELDELLIVDCGTGFRNLGNDLLNGNKQLRGRIFITHPHWDHLQGFPFFKPFYNDDAWFRIYLPPQKGVGCKEILQGHMSNTFFPVTIDMLNADMDCETFYPGKINFEAFSVDYMWARHTVKTAMFKFEIGGNTIIMAPDNELPLGNSESDKEFLKAFKDFIQDADVLVHDAQFNLEQYKEREGWGHSSWERVLEVVEGSSVKKLILTHHDPDSTDTYLTELNDELQSKFGDKFEEVCFIKEGQDIILPSK